MCPQLNNLENGYMVYTDANFVGSIVQFVCLPESYLEGTSSSICVDRNPQPLWDSTQPKCCIYGSKCPLSSDPPKVRFQLNAVCF